MEKFSHQAADQAISDDQNIDIEPSFMTEKPSWQKYSEKSKYETLPEQVMKPWTKEDDLENILRDINSSLIKSTEQIKRADIEIPMEQ